MLLVGVWVLLVLQAVALILNLVSNGMKLASKSEKESTMGCLGAILSLVFQGFHILVLSFVINALS